MAKKSVRVPATNNEIRRIMLQYFYDRNENATSARGKKGTAVKISDVKRELKATGGLTQQEVQSNLTYLISQGWVEEDTIEKSFTAPSGTVIPSSTNFYKITAAGIDKIEGPGEFTMSKFHGIKIEATGQNIITVGDGNQVNAKYGELAQALADLRDSVTSSHPRRRGLGATGGDTDARRRLAGGVRRPCWPKSMSYRRRGTGLRR